ncbi:hypothetical protein TEA_015766 [Camellia sinensis var. sinensis]|uniref:Casein kinase substrate phosphoprotein PP28 domain-containing protein n=1 Tax=Camellia sinensis var. sinensis TaxID=542762 RepID=A0A4S4EAX1_CAMSN|nr:hypothetical protein TEA_015766 [Camellia sinensis var. sinensis]
MPDLMPQFLPHLLIRWLTEEFPFSANSEEQGAALFLLITGTPFLVLYEYRVRTRYGYAYRYRGTRTGTAARVPGTAKGGPVEAEQDEEERSEEESEEESDEEPEKRKGNQGIIEIENPNLVKPKTLKAKDVDIEKTTELSRREREEIEKQKAHERYMRMQEQGKTEQARKDLERLALIRQQRAEAAKKRDEEKAGNVQRLVH